MVRDHDVHQRGVPLRDPAAVAEQHPHRDLGRGREARDDAGGQHPREPGVERQPAALGELQHHDRDKRLHDAAGAKAVGRPHRGRRRHPSEADDAGPGAKPGAVYVQDRSREVRARSAERVVQRPLEPTRQDRIQSPATASRRRSRESLRARGAPGPGGSKPAGRAQQQRPAVDQAPAQAIRKRANVAVWDSIIRGVHGPRSLDSVVARPPWARR